MPLSVSDRLEIMDLLARYCHAIDFGTAEEWADCFVPEGLEFDARPVAHCHTRAELVAFATEVAGRTRHWTCNVVIDGGNDSEGDGDVATAKSFQISIAPGVASATGPTARYLDRLRRTPQGWRIEHRTVEFDEAPQWPPA